MSGCLFLFTTALSIAGFFYPFCLWPVYGIWLFVWLMSLPWQKYRFDPNQSVFTEEQIPILQKYQAFFNMPHAAAGISNAAAGFTLVSFVACIVLLFQHRWIDAAIMSLIWLSLGGLRKRMHPIFMLREEKARYHAMGAHEKWMKTSLELAGAVDVLRIVRPAVASDFFKPEDEADLYMESCLKGSRP